MLGAKATGQEKAKKNKYGAVEWTLWDRFVFTDDPSLREIVTWFSEKHSLDVSMVSQGVSMLWSSFIGKKKVSVPCVRMSAAVD